MTIDRLEISGNPGCAAACLALEGAGGDGELALPVADGGAHGMPLHDSCQADAALDPSALRLSGTTHFHRVSPSKMFVLVGCVILLPQP